MVSRELRRASRKGYTSKTSFRASLYCRHTLIVDTATKSKRQNAGNQCRLQTEAVDIHVSFLATASPPKEVFHSD